MFMNFNFLFKSCIVLIFVGVLIPVSVGFIQGFGFPPSLLFEIIFKPLLVNVSYETFCYYAFGFFGLFWVVCLPLTIISYLLKKRES